MTLQLTEEIVKASPPKPPRKRELSWGLRTRMKLRRLRLPKYTAPVGESIALLGHFALSYSGTASPEPSLFRTIAAFCFAMCPVLGMSHPVIRKLVNRLENSRKEKPSFLNKIIHSRLVQDYIDNPFRYIGKWVKSGTVALMISAVLKLHIADFVMALTGWFGGKVLTLRPQKRKESIINENKSTKIREFAARNRYVITCLINHIGALTAVAKGYISGDYGLLVAGICYFTANNILGSTRGGRIPEFRSTL